MFVNLWKVLGNRRTRWRLGMLSDPAILDKFLFGLFQYAEGVNESFQGHHHTLPESRLRLPIRTFFGCGKTYKINPDNRTGDQDLTDSVRKNFTGHDIQTFARFTDNATSGYVSSHGILKIGTIAPSRFRNIEKKLNGRYQERQDIALSLLRIDFSCSSGISMRAFNLHKGMTLVRNGGARWLSSTIMRPVSPSSCT
jgi:hypothetical protein